MRQYRRLALLVLVANLIVTGLVDVRPRSARAASAGTIEGQLVAKGATTPVGGHTVLLEIGTGAATPVERTVTTSADGGFRFEDVPLVASAVYLVKVVYEGGAYFRDVAFAKDASTATTGPIEVYPATKSDAAVSFARLRMLVTTVDVNGLQIVETGAFVNQGTAAYIGSGDDPPGASLRFQVPAGAMNVAIATGLNRNTLVDAPGGFAALEAIVPGEHQFAYTYDLAANGSTLVLSRHFAYRTELFQIYVPEALRLESPLLTDSGVTALPNGQRFRIYTAQNVPVGAALRATVRNLPSGADAVNPLYPAMAVFVLLLGLGLLIAYGRRPKVEAAPAGEYGPAGAKPRPMAALASGGTFSSASLFPPTGVERTEALLARRRELLLELVTLDERRAANEIGEDAHRLLRAECKRELTSLLGNLRAITAPRR